jgi:recombination protein RecR
MQYPQNLERLFSFLRRLPGVGRRTAERYGFDLLLHWSKEEINGLSAALESLETIACCEVCGCLKDHAHCLFCFSPRRTKELLCIVASPREVFTIEQTGEFRGVYHVISGLLSPLDGRGAQEIGLEKLIARLQEGEIKEVIVALDSSLEGDTTALFLKDELSRFPITVSRPAFGIPVGSALEYVDGGTLARAFVARNKY